MKEYSIKDLFFTSWHEITPVQIITLIELTEQIRHLEKGTKEWGLLSIAILRILRKNKSLVSKIDVEQAVDCFNDITFFHRNDDGTFRTPWYFFPVAGFKMNGFEFQAPASSSLPLGYHTFEQLVYADSSFSAYCLLNFQYNNAITDLEKKQYLSDMEEALCSLIAVLYTNPDEFDIQDVEVKKRLVPLKMKIAQRALILHTYANIRKFITDRCPNLFPKPINDDDEDPGEATAPTYTGPMWMNLRYDLAKTDVFKGLEVTNRARIYDALDFLEKEAVEAKQRQPHGKA